MWGQGSRQGTQPREREMGTWAGWDLVDLLQGLFSLCPCPHWRFSLKPIESISREAGAQCGDIPSHAEGSLVGEFGVLGGISPSCSIVLLRYSGMEAEREKRCCQVPRECRDTWAGCPLPQPPSQAWGQPWVHGTGSSPFLGTAQGTREAGCSNPPTGNVCYVP